MGHAVCGTSQAALPSGGLWLGCQQASGLHNCNPCWPVIGVMAIPRILPHTLQDASTAALHPGPHQEMCRSTLALLSASAGVLILLALEVQPKSML